MIFAAIMAGFAFLIAVLSAVVGIITLDAAPGESTAAWWTFLVAIGFALVSLILYQLARCADALEWIASATTRRASPTTAGTSSADRTATPRTPLR